MLSCCPHWEQLCLWLRTLIVCWSWLLGSLGTGWNIGTSICTLLKWRQSWLVAAFVQSLLWKPVGHLALETVPFCLCFYFGWSSPETGTGQGISPHWQSAPSWHFQPHAEVAHVCMAACVAICTALQAGWCLCPWEWRFPLREGGSVPGQQMGRSSSSWDTMYDHHVDLQSAAMPKWPLPLSCLWSGLFLSQQLRERCKGRQWALPSIHHQGGEPLKAQGTFLFLSGAAKLSPCCSLSPVQAELFVNLASSSRTLQFLPPLGRGGSSLLFRVAHSGGEAGLQQHRLSKSPADQTTMQVAMKKPCACSPTKTTQDQDQEGITLPFPNSHVLAMSGAKDMLRHFGRAGSAQGGLCLDWATLLIVLWFQVTPKAWACEGSSPGSPVGSIQHSSASKVALPPWLKGVSRKDSRLSTPAPHECCNAFSCCGLGKNSMHYWDAINVCGVIWCLILAKLE